MELLERYDLILNQGIDELGNLEMPEDKKKLFELQGLLAPRLSPSRYRTLLAPGQG